MAKSLTYYTDLQRQKEAIAQLNAQWTSKQDFVRRRTEEVEKAEVSLNEQKKAVERSKVANQQLRERLEEQLRNASEANTVLVGGKGKEKTTSGDGEQAIINPEQGASGEQPIVLGKLLEQHLKEKPKAVRIWSD